MYSYIDLLSTYAERGASANTITSSNGDN